MNKSISSRFAIALIVLAALTVYVCLELAKGSIPQYESFNFPSQSLAEDNQTKNNCQAHAYQGEAKIKVWPIMENEEKILMVTDEDMAKIPVENEPRMKLIDADPVLEKKLSGASEKNPVEIKISGFATQCDGISLASLEYQEGIFRPYLFD
jgi:hypothetical protein